MSDEPKAVTMEGKSKREWNPKLRFPEFPDAPGWAEKQLDEVCEVNPDNDGLPESFIYIDLGSVDSGSLTVRKRISRSDAPSRAQRVLADRDVIFQMVRPYQRNNLFFDFGNGGDYVASTGYAQLRAHDSSKFLFQLVHDNSFIEKVIAKCTGSNYPAINSSDLAAVVVSVPHSVKEQQKIADCLSSLDELITAHSGKLDALKTHKKGLMQQFFPREGEKPKAGTVMGKSNRELKPKLRFSEFHDTGAWDSQPIGGFATILKGKGVSKADLTINGELPCIRYGELYTHYGEVIEEILSRTNVPADKLVLSKKQDVIIPASGETKEDIATASCVMLGNVALGSDLNIVRSALHGPFLSYYLNGTIRFDIAKMAQGDTVAHLYPGQLEKIEVRYPKPAEQKKIADCLNSLAELIVAHSRNLDALKVHKKGLMQQLFPSPNEVQA